MASVGSSGDISSAGDVYCLQHLAPPPQFEVMCQFTKHSRNPSQWDNSGLNVLFLGAHTGTQRPVKELF